ncbi:MAG: hypothetical protein Q9174_000009 [Haloplaca sp. 1 TL-2023]
MAAALVALNARIRSNKVLDYVCSTPHTLSTDFWGPASNFGIPIAAIADMQKDPELSVLKPIAPPPPISHTLPYALPNKPQVELHRNIMNVTNAMVLPRISGRMTAALTIYSGTFARYSMAVTPKNYLLLACHTINFASQTTQGVRFLKYWNYGGREEALKMKEGLQAARQEGKNILHEGEEKAKEVKGRSTG